MFGQASVPSQPVNHIRVNEALTCLAVPLVFGTARVSGKMIWAADLQASQHQASTNSKGFGVKGSPTYTYTASMIILLCAGPIQGVNSLWDQSGQYIPQTIQTTFTIPPGVGGNQPVGPPPDPQFGATVGVQYL